jgi:cobalt-zinc-cadmium efflux system outer membrane protein
MNRLQVSLLTILLAQVPSLAASASPILKNKNDLASASQASNIIETNQGFYCAKEPGPLLIAAGYPSRPAQSTPMPSGTPSPSPISAPAQAPPSILVPESPLDRIPVPKENPQPPQEPQKSPAKVTIEFNEGLAPVSNQPGLSVVEALNEALRNSPRASAIRSQLAIARAGFATATQAPNPVMFVDRGLVAEQEMRIGPLLTEEPLWKLAFRMLATKRLVDQTKIDLLTQLWSLRADVRRAYVELVVAQETQKTLVELYDLSAKLLGVADKRFHAGDTPELDVLRARLATTQSEVDVQVGRKRVLRGQQQLNVIMGRLVEQAINVPGLPNYSMPDVTNPLPKSVKSDVLPDFSKPVPPLEDFIALANEHRLELKSLAKQILVNRANQLGAYGNTIPNPTIATGKSTEGNPTAGPKLTAVFFTVNAEMPMTNWNQGDIFRFKATGKQLAYQVGSQKNQILADVSSAYQNLVAQRERIRVYQEHVLADSLEVARLARRSYEVGQSDITSSLQAQQANVQIREQYLDAVTSYANAFTDLEQSCGLPLQ